MRCPTTEISDPAIHPVLAGLLVVFLWAPCFAANPVAHLEAFYKVPVLRQIELSPDGTHIAMLRNVEDQTLLLVQKLGEGQPKAIVRSDNVEMKIKWFEWANNDRLLVSVAVPISDVRAEYLSTQLFSFDKGGGEGTLLVKPKGRRFKKGAEHFSQFQDRIVSLLPDDPEHILLALDAEEVNSPGVYLAKVDDDKKRLVVEPRSPIREWLADQQGRVRVGVGFKDTTVTIMIRGVEDDDWRTAWEYEVFESSIDPLGFGLDPDILYVEALHDGRTAVFKVDLANPELKLELIHADPEYDIDAYLVYSPRTRDVVGIKFYTDTLHYLYFNKTYETFQNGIDKVLPHTANHFVSFSDNETRYLVFSTSETNPGTFYYGDIVKKQLVQIAEQYPGLNETTLCGKEEIEYEARDGLNIEGYLTRPKDVAEDELLPAVILPHGGPISRETGGFDLWSEFLAGHGYAVLQMNFRGSSGYGQDFANASLQAWGLEMQDDIIDGTKWLIEQKIADPERICIVGASYGGYAALLGGIEHPELFKCAASFAAVTDLRRLVFESRSFTNRKIVEKQIGGFHSHAEQLEQKSPVRLAKQLEIPVLIAHGTRDTVVPFDHAELMVNALEKHKKDFTFTPLANGDHNLSLQSNRTVFFEHLERLLSEHIGIRAQPVTAGADMADPAARSLREGIESGEEG